MANSLLAVDNSAALFKYMEKACAAHDSNGYVQRGLLGYLIKDKLMNKCNEIMDMIKYRQKMIVEFSKKTGNLIDVGPIDGILGKQTILAAKRYLILLETMKELVGYPNPMNMLITNSFNPNQNSYNTILMRDAIFFENFKFNPSMEFYQHILNNKIRSLATRGIEKIAELDIHESTTNSATATVDILRCRGWSVHFIIDAPDENNNVTIYQNMPINKTSWHLNTAHNGCSIGIEIVNPYYPEWASGVFKYARVISNKKAHKGKYVTPYSNQINALHKLVTSLGTLMDIDFISNIREVRHGEFNFEAGHLANAFGGIMSHYSVGGHADGVFPVYQLWRLANGLGISWDELDNK